MSSPLFKDEEKSAPSSSGTPAAAPISVSPAGSDLQGMIPATLEFRGIWRKAIGYKDGGIESES